MKQNYKIAENVISVSVPDDLAAWDDVVGCYTPFAVGKADEPVLEVDIRVGNLTAIDGTMIYEPVYNNIGFVTASTWRLADGSLVIEFKHVDEQGVRLRVQMSPALNRADIVMPPGRMTGDEHFLTHALMIAYMLGTCHNGTLVMHSAAVIQDGKAYLFQGKSGTGKSTHAALWTRNIAGTELLNDDNPIVRFTANGVATAYGSPWSGKTDCYRNLSAPLGAFVRIVRDTDNALHRLAPLKAYASLTASVFYMPFMSDELKEMRHKTIERLVGTVPCCEMHCRPDRDAAITCHRALSIKRHE